MNLNNNEVISRIFSETVLIDKDTLNELFKIIKKKLPSYPFDQYKFYPSIEKNSWEKYFLLRLENSLKNNEWLLFYDFFKNSPYLLSCKISKWDEEHFGFKMAFINVLICNNKSSSRKIIGTLLDKCLVKLRNMNVRFVSSRIHGDNIQAIHVFEDKGFHFYENIIWPVISCNNISLNKDPQVRLMVESDFDSVINIAENYTYQRGHYFCDEKFDKKSVNTMYGKWVKTSWNNKEPIAVIESKGKIWGFFVFRIDDILSNVMGYKYGRMRSLALDVNARGKGFGRKLFESAMAIMKEMGVEYIDSGYSSKNHISAKLHSNNSFCSVYEEVTFHKWL